MGASKQNIGLYHTRIERRLFSNISWKYFDRHFWKMWKQRQGNWSALSDSSKKYGFMECVDCKVCTKSSCPKWFKMFVPDLIARHKCRTLLYFAQPVRKWEQWNRIWIPSDLVAANALLYLHAAAVGTKCKYIRHTNCLIKISLKII